MDKRFIAVLACTSLLGVEVVEDKHSRHWIDAANHTHTEIPESVARDFRGGVSVDSTATAATTGLLDILPTRS